MDPRYLQFAHTMVNYSVEVKKGQVVIIDTWDDVPVEMVLAIVQKVQEAGGKPISWRINQRVLREILLRSPSDRQLRVMGLGDLAQLAAADAYIVLRGFSNTFELEDVPAENMKLYGKHYLDLVQDERIEHTRWILGRWPTPAMAQLAQMSTERFTDFFFKVVNLDYRKMARAAEPLRKLMASTDQVRIKAPGTDLRFSIKGIGAVPCIGTRNIPDGEVYSAPVRNSVNGIITYNTKTVTKDSRIFEGVSFTFKDGKILKSTCRSGDQVAMEKLLDTDEGARYIGEFALGFNPYITNTIGETLFDEKVAGSLHFTPGRAYKIAWNGNDSAVHWDIVLVQTPEKGGGEIYFDGTLVRKDGRFVPKGLQGLNPEHLR